MNETPADEAPADGEGAPVVVVDAGPARCPMPVIMAARRAKELPAGTRLRVLSQDPATVTDLPAWCRMRGHTVLELHRDTGDAAVEVLLELGAGPNRQG